MNTQTINCRYTADQLFNKMIRRDTITVVGQPCLIQAIAMEDGSGTSFNVTFLNVVDNETFIKYVKTDR